MHDLYGNTNLTDSNFSSENIEASGKRHTIFQVVKEKILTPCAVVLSICKGNTKTGVF